MSANHSSPYYLTHHNTSHSQLTPNIFTSDKKYFTIQSSKSTTSRATASVQLSSKNHSVLGSLVYWLYTHCTGSALTAQSMQPEFDNQSRNAHMFITSTRAGDRLRLNPYWVFTRSDRRTDRSVRLVCPTGRSDDRIV